MADENLSGVPPVVTISGLPSGPGSFSGASQQAPASGLSGYGQVTPGIEGGLGLDMLSQLLQQAGSADQSVGTGALTPFTAQSLGQQTGGLSAGAFGQGGGQGLIAGGMGTGAGAQQQTGAGSVDPLSIIQKLLGLGSKAAGAAGSLIGIGSPTIGDTGGASLSDQLRSQQQAAGGNAQLNGITPPAAFTASPTGDPNAPGVPPSFADPNALGGLPGAPGGGQDLSLTNTLGQSTVNPQLAEALQSALGSGFTPDQIQAMLGSLNPAAGFGAGEIPGGGSISSGVSGAPTASPTGLSGSNLLGAGQGGLSALQSLLSAYQTLTGSGTDAQKAIGTAQATSGAAQGGAAASDALGLTSGLAGSLGEVLGPLGIALTAASIGSAPLPSSATAARGEAQAQEGNQILAATLPALLVSGGAFAAPILGIALALQQAFNPVTNYAANKESGVVGPQLTSQLNAATQGVPQDLSGLSTPALEALIPQLGQGLQGLFSPAGAGIGTANSQTDISRYRAGLASADPQAAANIQREQDLAQSGLLQDIGLLQQRGIGNDVIGGLLGGGDAEAARIAQLNAGGGPTASGSFASLDPTLQNAFQSYYQTAGNPGAEATPFGTGSYGNNLLAPNFNQQAFGGNTWYLLNKLGLDTPQMLARYGIQAPGFNQPYLQGLMNPVLSNLAPPVPTGQVAGYLDSGGGTA